MTRAETRFGLSAKRTSPFKSAGRGLFSRLLAAEVCASAVVMVVMLDTPCSEVECKTTGYPLHSPVSPSLPLPCVAACHQVSTELYELQPAGEDTLNMYSKGNTGRTSMTAARTAHCYARQFDIVTRTAHCYARQFDIATQMELFEERLKLANCKFINIAF